MNSNVCSILFKLPAPLIIITLWILSSRSALSVIKGPLGFDKLLHFSAYAALSAAAGLWFSPESRLTRPMLVFLICAAVASGYGIIDELHQYFVPGRSCSIFDWVADILGGAAGAALILAAARLWKI